jgi:hypothetical protein
MNTSRNPEYRQSYRPDPYEAQRMSASRERWYENERNRGGSALHEDEPQEWQERGDYRAGEMGRRFSAPQSRDDMYGRNADFIPRNGSGWRDDARESGRMDDDRHLYEGRGNRQSEMPQRNSLGQFTSGRSGQHTGRGPKGYRRSDDRINEDVSEALSQDPDLDASEIEVKVQNGEVVLTGTVEERQFKRMAEEIAERCSGVQDVRNEIRVQQANGAMGRRENEPAQQGKDRQTSKSEARH